jgi:hypothetical protein
LVWVKWTTGSYILTRGNSLEFFGKSPHGWGNLVYSSAFFLNAVLAGVRYKWGAWPWSSSFPKKNGIFKISLKASHPPSVVFPIDCLLVIQYYIQWIGCSLFCYILLVYANEQ